jgi:hypothetical protein
MTLLIRDFPTVDGHFWVVRDGKIIDWDFTHYDMVKKIWGLTDEQIHLEADENTQKIMLAIFQKKLLPEHIPEYLSALDKHFLPFQPTEGMCYQNCILEVFRNGGEIKFGSMGWKKKSDGTVWYEFGGKDWTGVKQFMKIGIANREAIKKDEEEDEEDDDVYVCAYNW